MINTAIIIAAATAIVRKTDRSLLAENGPVTQQIIDPDLRRYKEQMLDIFWGRWPTTVLVFSTATAKRSERLLGSR